jgi:hypothetical protein
MAPAPGLRLRDSAIPANAAPISDSEAGSGTVNSSMPHWVPLLL